MFAKIKENPGSILMSIGEIVVGVLLLVDPVRFTTGIIVALGALLSVLGGVSIGRYFTTEPKRAAREQRLSKGLFFLFVGLFCMLRNGWFIDTFPALSMLYGFGLMTIGFIKVQRAVDMLRMKREMWFVAAVAAAGALIIAALILVNPFESALLVWVIIGVSLIAEAVCDLMAVFLKKAPAKNPAA